MNHEVGNTTLTLSYWQWYP